MRVLICGGRNFEDRDMAYRVLDSLHEQHRFSVVIHGAARGADTVADQWAIHNRLPIYRCHAHWKLYNSAAGPIRNAKMLERGKPDLVVAFPRLQGHQGHGEQGARRARQGSVRIRADGKAEAVGAAGRFAARLTCTSTLLASKPPRY